MPLIEQFTKNKLTVKVFASRKDMGKEAAGDVGNKLRELLEDQNEVNVIFASAPSQNEFLASLVREPGIEWARVNAFHMDEYVGLAEDAPQRFSQFLKENIFDKVPFKAIYYINATNGDTAGECARYAGLLKRLSPDVVCMGIGENAHVAFNDPHVADFNDPLLVKQVTLDDVSRQQQVNDGCFDRFELVPKAAITVTVPGLLQAKNIYCMVPGKNKAHAVYQTLHNDIGEDVPSTALRNHQSSVLYLDKESASKLAF